MPLRWLPRTLCTAFKYCPRYIQGHGSWGGQGGRVPRYFLGIDIPFFVMHSATYLLYSIWLNFCLQMSDFKVEMHPVQFRLGLCPRPR